MNIIFCFALKENMLFLKAVDYYLYCLERQTGNLTNCPGLGEGALYHKTIIHGEIHHLSAAARIYSSSNLFWFNSSWDTQLLQLHPSDLYPQRVHLIPVYPQQESVCVRTTCVCMCQNAFNGRSIVSRPVCFPFATQLHGHLIWSSRGQITLHQWTVVFKPTRPRWSFTERAIFRSVPQDQNKTLASTKGGTFVFALVLLWELYLYSRETNVTTSLSARHDTSGLDTCHVVLPFILFMRPSPCPHQGHCKLPLYCHWAESIVSYQTPEAPPPWRQR